MKDEHDNHTVDLDDMPRPPKPFKAFRSVLDEQSYGKDLPRGVRASLLISGGIEGGRYVPVSFVARDWGVTPRRIRALLTDGRLLGRLQVNGYWEVRYPYSFTFGTRGPSLKRQQRPPKRSKPATEKPELKLV